MLGAGELFALVDPSLLWAVVFFAGFVLARVAHSVAYLTTRNQEVRATFYTIGSMIVIAMAVWVLAVALFG